MGYDENSLSPPFEVGEQFRVEDLLKFRVLISSPFIEDVEGTVFQEGREQGQSLALPVRQLDRGEHPIFYIDFLVELELRQITLCPSVKLRRQQAEEALEQVEVGKDG